MAEEINTIDSDVPVQPQPSKVDKLYNSLLSDGYKEANLGNRQQFTQAMSDPSKSAKIYQSLRTDGYNEDNLGKLEEFQSLVGKKASGTGGGNTSVPSKVGGLQDLNSLTSTTQQNNYAPVTNPQVKQQLVAQDDAIRQKRKTEQDRLTQQLSKVVKEVPGMDKVLEYNSSRTPDVLREPTEEERAHQDFMKTRLGKVLGKVAYIGRGATKGTLQLAKGATTIMGDAFNTGSLGAMTKVASDYVYDKADENTNMGLSKSDINNYETDKGMSANGVRAASQVAELATTMFGGEAFSAPKAMFFLQGTGQGKETMDAVKKSGAKVNPVIEKVFPYATGAINGLLMGDLGETLFGKIPSNARSAVVNSIAAEALEKSAGKELTGETLQTLLRDGAKTFADKFEQTGIKALSHYNTTVKDLAKLQTANYLLKKGVDEVNDTPVFHENLGNLAEGLSKMATTEAPLFAIPGLVKDATHMLIPNSSFKNEIVNSLVENPTAENVDHIKKQLYDYGFDQDKADKWSPEQMQATYEQVDKVAKIAQSLPKGLDIDKSAEAVDLINGRDKMHEQLTKIKEQKKTLDPSLHELVNPYEQNLADKIDQADDKLRTLATGKQATYRAGTGDEEGKYFKKVDGKDEEITKSRYELEHFERNARSEANTEPVNEDQPQDEQTPVTQENVAHSEDNEAKQTTFTNADIANADPNEPQDAKIKAVQESFADGDKVEFKVDGKVLSGEVKNGRIQDEEGNHWGWLGILTGKDNYIKKLDGEQGVENNTVEGGVQENEAPAGNAPQEDNPKWEEENWQEWEKYRVELEKSIFHHSIDENMSIKDNIERINEKLDGEYAKIKNIIGDEETSEKYIAAIKNSPKSAKRIRNGLTDEQIGLLFNRINEDDFEDNHEYKELEEYADTGGLSDFFLFNKLGYLLTSPRDMNNPINRVIAKNLIVEASERGFTQKEILQRAVEHLVKNGNDISNITQLIHATLKNFGAKGEKGNNNQQAIESGAERMADQNSDEAPIVQPTTENAETARRQKAIDAIQHGIIGGHERPGETQARFDLGMDAADKTKALNDIIKGKYDTAPAKRMIEKVMEFDRNDEYPIIEGTGGNSFRNKSATAAEIQEHIDAAKQLTLNNNLSEAEIAESNKALEELGITHDDIKQYEEYRASQEQPANRSATTSNEETVQQSSNDRSTGITEDTGGQESQKNRTKWVDPANKANVEELAENHGIELEDTVGETRTKKVVNKEAREAIKDGLDPRDLVQEILETDRKTDTDVAILSKHLDATERRVKDIKDRLEKDGANMSKAEFDDLMNERERAFKELADAAQASRKLQTISGRQLNAFKQMVTRDYSLGDLLSRKREANSNNELTKEQVQEVNDRFDELEKTRTALEKRIAKLEEDNAKLKAESKVKNTAVERLRRKSVSKEKLAEERKQIADDFSKKLKEMRTSGALNSAGKATLEFLSAAAPYVAKMVRNLAEEGIVELKDVVGRVKEELDLKDLSDREVTDLIGGVYDEKKPTKSELSERVSSLKQQAKLAAQIEDLENGIKRVKPESSAAAKKNEQVENLRKRLAELNKGEEVPKEVKDLNRYKKSKQDQIDELNKKIAAGDYSKPEPAKPVTLDPEALALRRKYDKLKHEFDLGVERDKLAQRTKTEKLKDNILNIASLPRALKATLDFSAPGRQGLLLSIGHPEAAKVAMKEMFGQTFSEERYRNWLSDLKHTDLYDLMMNSDLYLSDKTNIQLLAREEMFTSNLAERIPVLGKAVAGAERAYTAYLNVIRSQVFTSEASKLLERGYTFENNPEVFKGIAKVINVLSGRGDIPEFLGGKQPAILSNLLFSPRFMASRIQTLYLWADPRLPKEARILAAKDIGKTLGTAATILTMAAMAGATVEKDPRSSDFLKIKVDNTRYDILGGLSPYVVFLSQELSGQKKPTSNKGMIYLNSKKFGSPTRASLAMNFMRGKLAPVPGMIYNLGEGKDLIGNEYHLWPNVPQEFVPLPFTDVYDAYKVGGWKNSLEVLIPAQFGIGVSSYDANKKK